MMRRVVQACVLAVLAGVVTAPAASAGVDQGAPTYYDSGLAPTPYMGWNTYYGLGAPTEDQVKGVAEYLDPGTAFGQFRDAVARSGRRMLLNLCNPVTADWGLPTTPEQTAGYNYVWGPTTGDSWRTDTDIAFGTPYPGEWKYVLRN